MTVPESDRQLILFSSADWRTPYWTNKQHIAKRLAERGWSVLYIETVGLRTPGLGRLDAGRMLRRLRAAGASPRQAAKSLWIASPVTLPVGHRSAAAQRLNGLLLGRALRRWMARLNFRRPVIWTYHPFMMQAIAGLDRRTLVYHCVDELSAVPGIDATAFLQAERQLLQTADVVFASSPALRDKCAAVSQRTHYLPNVADIGHFMAARGPGNLPPALAAIPRPRMGYAGALSDFKVDFPLILRVAERKPDWHLVFIGDERVGQHDPVVERLRGLANTHFLGWRDYGELPAFFRGLDVGLLPLRVNDYTRAVFPMKFFEYLAAGLPVVATNLPALEAYRSLYRHADDNDAFIVGIEDALADPARFVLPRNHAALIEHDWETQLEKMLDVVERSSAGRA